MSSPRQKPVSKVPLSTFYNPQRQAPPTDKGSIGCWDIWCSLQLECTLSNSGGPGQVSMPWPSAVASEPTHRITHMQRTQMCHGKTVKSQECGRSAPPGCRRLPGIVLRFSLLMSSLQIKKYIYLPRLKHCFKISCVFHGGGTPLLWGGKNSNYAVFNTIKLTW